MANSSGQDRLRGKNSRNAEEKDKKIVKVKVNDVCCGARSVAVWVRTGCWCPGVKEWDKQSSLSIARDDTTTRMMQKRGTTNLRSL